MSQVALQNSPSPDGATLETLLSEMSKYGRPRIGMHGKTWHCCVDMFVTGIGVEFKIASSFDEATPLQAAWVCWERLDEALKGLKRIT